MRESERKLANTWRGIFLLRSHWAHSIIAAVGDGTGGLMKSSIVKHSIVINAHKTSVSLENAFWSDLKEIAGRTLQFLPAARVGIEVLT